MQKSVPFYCFECKIEIDISDVQSHMKTCAFMIRYYKPLVRMILGMKKATDLTKYNEKNEESL